MRYWINLIESSVSVPEKYQGSYIEPDGKVHFCNHDQEHHHSDIAFDRYENEINYGAEYSNPEWLTDDATNIALEMALSNGWLKISHITWGGPPAVALQWNNRLTKIQIEKLENQLNSIPNMSSITSFSIEHNNSNNNYVSYSDFLLNLYKELKRR